AIVPYFNLYSVGGPNSLRGFAPRQVGPAATVPKGNNLLTQGGFGNIVFETSLEFRQKLNSLIEVAVFTDAGNVWTYKSTLEPIETDFRSKTFIEQLAVDAGIGLRLDFEFLIFRLDLATPLVFPFEDAQQALPPEERENVKMGQIVPQIAFGYPF
ncbi:MAG: BamA/TamA family outer membrane protein, partial [Saprospiraceae bacterium]